ncbi:hypothetical protein PT974_05652 [Cladobotryum mycophilum]|uniref:Uncharacterized protein n=1 Tax=Cladobotryum mycophilum TaxID=491253 RepID=A0ABR0SKC5_9HYPO
MWYHPRETTAHKGTTPAAAMTTPFSFPCGPDFLDDKFQNDKEVRDTCAPPAWEEYWWSSVGYYSPAICPSGYTAGCLRWDSRQGPPVEATETAVQCVPSGFMCANRDISMAFSYTATTPMIQVRWAESDLSLFATHPLQPGANPTEHHMTMTQYQPPNAARAVMPRAKSYEPSFTPTGGGDGGELSSGAKAGIGIGVVLGVLVVAGIIGFFIWRSRRAARNEDIDAGQIPPPISGGPHPVPPEMGEGFTGRYELPVNSTASPTVVGSDLGITPPPAAFLAKDKSDKAELPGDGRPVGAELEAGNNWSHYSVVQELHAESRPAEMEHTPQSSSMLSVERKQVGSPIQHISETQTPASPGVGIGPDTGVSIMPGEHATASPPPAPYVSEIPAEPSAQEMVALMDQHTQLEERRRRILELERIEREQTALQQKIQAMRGGGDQQ